MGCAYQRRQLENLQVRFDQPIEKILVCELDAIEASAKSPEALECFGNLSRKGFSKGTMTEFLLHKQVTEQVHRGSRAADRFHSESLAT
jgi:hypothetical protein